MAKAKPKRKKNAARRRITTNADTPTELPQGGVCTADGRLSELAQQTGYLVDRIILGPTYWNGNRFEIFSFDCVAVPGATPSICPNADRKPQAEWLPRIDLAFRKRGLVAKGQTIHWVGSQSRADNVCGCDLDAVGQHGQHATPEPLNPLQKRILQKLDGRALKVEELANEIRCDRRALYKPGGIKELNAAGRVAHKRRVGYYRPDRPPAE